MMLFLVKNLVLFALLPLEHINFMKSLEILYCLSLSRSLSYGIKIVNSDILSTLVYDVGLPIHSRNRVRSPLVELQNNTSLESLYRAQIRMNLNVPLLHLT